MAYRNVCDVCGKTWWVAEIIYTTTKCLKHGNPKPTRCSVLGNK